MATIKSEYRRKTSSLRILRALRRQGASKVSLLKNYLNIDSSLSRILKTLLKRGYVEKVERGVYRITEDGIKKLEEENF